MNAAALAQETPAAPPAAAPQRRVVTVQNLAPLVRREVAAVVVPFARGAVPALPDLHAEGRPTAWQAFGARWPDGSLRQALCLFPVELPALGEAAVALVPGAGPAPAGDFPPLPATIAVVARTEAGDARVVPDVVERLEDNALRRVDLRRARLGTTGLVVELIVAQGRNDAHAYVDVAVFFSDPTTKAMQCAVHELAIETEGMALLLRHPQRLAVEQTTTERGSRVVLLQGSSFGDGQGLRRAGALVPALTGRDAVADSTAKAAVVCPLLAGTPWSGTDAFGPFGEPAATPPWLLGEALRAAMAARHRAFAAAPARGDAFAAPWFGPTKNAGQTGDQMDFGVVKLSVIASSGLPSLLLECEPSVLQEACRPVHVFDAAGAPLLSKDHPTWVVWSGRTHWHCEVSKDRLGKPCPEPPFDTHGWSGKDREHWSTNYLGAFAQLTGAHWARRELANEVQLFLAGQTIDPQFSTSGAGAPRGAGRTALAACWLWLATGDADLLRRMHERVDRVYLQQWPGRTLPEGSVRTMQIHSPDARMLQGKHRYWTPWQDAIAATGFAALHRLTGNAAARQLAEELALSVVRHGFRITDKECIVATALRWQDGAPLTAAQEQDPDCALWSYGTGFNEWALGAVEIARIAATARGDAALVARAEKIQARVRAGRKAPSDGWIDRMGEWDAVRWSPAAPDAPK